MFQKSLTIVLPIYNGETRLRACVGQLLDVASELTSQFAIQIVDDGSTDATYEVAEDLAVLFPQVTVRRHRHRRGLGATIEAAQRHCRSEVLIVHDGVTPIDPNQVRRLWRDCVVAPYRERAATSHAAGSLVDLTDCVPVAHKAMEQVHRRILGFQLLSPLGNETHDFSARSAPSPTTPRTAAAPATCSKGVGEIPTLPRPKFMSALAAFARDE